MIVLRSGESYNILKNNRDLSVIFLAGPTPRNHSVKSWRHEALQILARMKYNGFVFVPEPFAKDYDTQVEWEWNGLNIADIVVFWIPRNMEDMLGLTTNVEFGMFVRTRHDIRYSEPFSLQGLYNIGHDIVYGRPEGAPHTRYLDWHYTRRTGKEPCKSLRETLEETIERLKEEIWEEK